MIELLTRKKNQVDYFAKNLFNLDAEDTVEDHLDRLRKNNEPLVFVQKTITHEPTIKKTFQIGKSILRSGLESDVSQNDLFQEYTLTFADRSSVKINGFAKNFLLNKSTVFKSMWSSQFKESQSNTTTLMDIPDTQFFHNMITLLRGKFDSDTAEIRSLALTENTLLKMISVAFCYQIMDLLEPCSILLKKKVDQWDDSDHFEEVVMALSIIQQCENKNLEIPLDRDFFEDYVSHYLSQLTDKESFLTSIKKIKESVPSITIQRLTLNPPKRSIKGIPFEESFDLNRGGIKFPRGVENFSKWEKLEEDWVKVDKRTKEYLESPIDDDCLSSLEGLHLKSLELCGIDSVNNFETIECQTSLEYLALKGLKDISDFDLEGVKALKKLKFLSVYGCSGVNGSFLQKADFNLLEFLSLTGCSIASENLSYIPFSVCFLNLSLKEQKSINVNAFTHLSQLKALRLLNNKIEGSFPLLPQLAYLDIYGCDMEVEFDLDKVLPHLTYLRLGGHSCNLTKFFQKSNNFLNSQLECLEIIGDTALKYDYLLKMSNPPHLLVLHGCETTSNYCTGFNEFKEDYKGAYINSKGNQVNTSEDLVKSLQEKYGESVMDGGEKVDQFEHFYFNYIFLKENR